LEAPDTVICVGERDGPVVGYVYAGLEPLSFIHDIVVSEDARRTGIARQLLQAALTWLREPGAPRAMLWTGPGGHTDAEPFRRLRQLSRCLCRVCRERPRGQASGPGRG
jgi:GNAT superfamily N-acetyltransferase